MYIGTIRTQVAKDLLPLFLCGGFPAKSLVMFCELLVSVYAFVCELLLVMCVYLLLAEDFCEGASDAGREALGEVYEGRPDRLGRHFDCATGGGWVWILGFVWHLSLL